MRSNFNRFKEVCKKNKIAIMSFAGSTLPVFAFAAEPTNATAYQSVLSSLTSAISVSDVALILGGCVAAGVGFFFLWFGARKAVGSFVEALTKGKIKL